MEKVFYKAGADYVISDMQELPEVIDRINGRLEQMAPYRLLTPGPLTTRRSVKEAMLKDHCTWDEEYKAITRSVLEDITAISANTKCYAAVLLQGSGSYAVEAMIQCFCRDEEKLLILANGAYGDRMVSEARLAGKNYEVLSFDPVHSLRPQVLEEKLKADPGIQTVMFVHSETTSGLINPVKELAQTARAYGKTVLVDAMSSFGAYEIDMEGWGIDALAASANKCLEGVPGLSFVVARKTLLEGSKGISKSLCLDLYGQYEGLYRGGGKFRFTSPTHVLLALRQALDEYKREGGLPGRRERYMENHRTLMRRMKQLGIESIVPEKDQSYIITTFHLGDLDFEGLYQYLKRQGFVIYPGKLTDLPTFRIGTIGDIYPSDMEELADAIAAYKHGAWWQ